MSEKVIGFMLADLTVLLFRILIAALIAVIVYKTVKRLITHKVKTEQQYREYYEAKKEIDDIEEDLKKHKDI